ncbi:MAG: hypothetical protein M3R57_07225 [Chloroflexota bacterium]|nr:hypothetical protein [Chloroflexota bacterium]
MCRARTLREQNRLAQGGEMATRLVSIVVTAFLGLILGSGSVLADEGGQHGDQNGDHNGKGLTCSGTPTAPGTIAPGTYESITVTGTCLIPSGIVRVRGDVSVKQGAVFLANFPPMGGPEGDATLLVRGDLTVGRGAMVVLGCSPAVGCELTTNDRIDGDVRADQPLGLIFHSNSIGGDISLRGGGGGVTCDPSGIFGPAYSTFEDSTIGGDVSIVNYNACWLGFIRNRSHGDVSIVNNQLADPDAIEILANRIAGDLKCRANSFVWDSSDVSPIGELWPREQHPNTVRGDRIGQCDKLQDPTTEGGTRGPLPF